MLSCSDCFVQIVSDIGANTRHCVLVLFLCLFKCFLAAVKATSLRAFEAALPPSLRILLMRAVESAINPEMQYNAVFSCQVYSVVVT